MNSASAVQTIGILTSGGDAPGMNAAIRAVARTAWARGINVKGIYRGYKGLLDQDIFEMHHTFTRNIITNGGTALYTARCLEFKELEYQKSAIEREMRSLKASVDASAIPEQKLVEILDMIVSTAGDDTGILLSIVYRVEVGQDTITIWTLLDADPNGFIDHTQDGVTISFGVPSGVPIVVVTAGFIRITVARKDSLPG